MTRHILIDPKTKLLSFRRAFPEDLRPFVPQQCRELKRSLGARSLNDPAAARLLAEAQADYDRILTAARLKASGTSRALTNADIVFLAATYAHELRVNLRDTHYDGNDDRRRHWLTASAWRFAPFGFMDGSGAKLAGRDKPWSHSERIREALPALISTWYGLRADGDRDGIVNAEGQTAEDLLARHNLSAAIGTPTFFALCLSLLAVDIAAGEQLQRLVTTGLVIDPAPLPDAAPHTPAAPVALCPAFGCRSAIVDASSRRRQRQPRRASRLP
jgi:hypothetical protein